MKKKILIISATSRNNLDLAKKIEGICIDLRFDNELINLEEYVIPLYTPIEEKQSIPSPMELIMKKFIEATGLIFCAPEYNGSIPPILTNVIAWLSVMKNDWRLVFNEKIGLIASYSGGPGNNLVQSLRIQLNHLGMIVLPRTIIVNKKMQFNNDTVQKYIHQMINLL